MNTVHFTLDVIIPRILELGMLRAPREACGLVVPNLEVPADDWVVEMTNRSENPINSYRLDPVTVRSLLEDQEDVWEGVLIWHTHPSGSVGPSKGDWDARHPQLHGRYLVVALPGGEATLF